MKEQVPTSGEVLAALLDRVWTINRIASSGTPGQSPTFYRVLGLLRDDGPQRVGDLAQRVHLSQPGMSKTVAQLAEHGFVERRTDPEDSRATLVAITDAGRTGLEERTSQIVDHLLPVFAPLSETERRTLQDAVDVLTKHMSAGLGPAEKE